MIHHDDKNQTVWDHCAGMKMDDRCWKHQIWWPSCKLWRNRALSPIAYVRVVMYLCYTGARLAPFYKITFMSYYFELNTLYVLHIHLLLYCLATPRTINEYMDLSNSSMWVFKKCLIALGVATHTSYPNEWNPWNKLNEYCSPPPQLVSSFTAISNESCYTQTAG